MSAVPDRSRAPRGSHTQVPMFRTQEKWGVGYYLPYNEQDTPENWQGNEVIEPSRLDRKPVNARSSFGGTASYWYEGSEEHRVRRAQQDHPALERTFRETEGLLGHDAPPARPNPNMRWQDLQRDIEWVDEGGHELNYSTPQGSRVASVYMEEDDWGPLVKTAEVARDYQGRGWSREMMGDIAQDYAGSGLIHSDGFTIAGEGAFQKKGVPEEDDIYEGSERNSKYLAEKMADQGRLIDGLMTSLGRRRPGDSHGPRYAQDRMRV